MNRDVVSILAPLTGWLASCLLAPYSLWRMIVTPLTDVALVEYIVLHLVIGVILLVGSFLGAIMIAGMVEGGFLMLIIPVSVLTILLGLGLMAIAQNLTAPSTFIPDRILTIMTGSVMIVSLAPFVISIASASVLIFWLMDMLLSNYRAN